MAKTLFLHVGMPKCASTSIQDVLKTRTEAFAGAGKFYAIPPGDKTVGQGNATRLLADIRAERSDRVERTFRFFLERDSDVILSSEGLIGLARNRMSDVLAERADKAGFAIQLLCYVRRQDQWIESDYKQHIKGGSDWAQGIWPLIERRMDTRVLDYHWLLENWTRSVPRSAITVVPLAQGQGEHYALERFLGFLGMEPGRAAELAVARRNVSPPGALVEPMRYLKTALLARGVHPGDIPEHLNRFAAAAARLTLPARRYVLSAAERRALVGRYAESNRRLAEDYLGGTAPFDPIAAADSEPVARTTLDQDAAAVLAGWIAALPDPGAPGALPGGSPWGRLRRRLQRRTAEDGSEPGAL